MATKDAIFIGSTIRGATDADEWFSPIKVPGNMSKQATIDAHLAKVQGARTAQREADATAFADSIQPNNEKFENHVQRPMTAVLASVCVMNSAGETLYQQAAADPIARGKVALPLINFLKESYPHQFGENLRYSDTTPEAAIIGFNLKQVLRIAAFEVFRRNVESPEAEWVRIPVRLWHSPIGVYDILDLLLPEKDQRDLDLYSVIKYFGLGVTADQLQGTAALQASTAFALARATQLFPLG